MAITQTRHIPFGIKDTNSGTTNSLSKLLRDETFNYNITKYPLNLGGTGQGRSHYIVFHILEQRKSQYTTDQGNAATGSTAYETERARNLAAAGSDATQGLRQGYDAALGLVNRGFNEITNSGIGLDGQFFSGEPTEVLSGALPELGNQINSTIIEGTKLSFLRTVNKTSETIALYMPDTLNFVQPQGYSDLELGNNFITALFAGGTGVADSIRAYNAGGTGRDFGQSLAKNLSPFLVNALGNKLGNFGRAVTAAGQGMVTNPMIEVLYTSPGLRSFRFDFMFYPESQKEAFAVQKIIQLFQFHQAPEIAPGTGGYFLVPPSEFDIEFYYNGTENVNLPAISTCVLTSVDVDYAPNGWSAYEIPGEEARMGGSGMPVATKLSLEFKETSIVTKASRQFDKSPISKPSSQTFPQRFS